MSMLPHFMPIAQVRDELVRIIAWATSGPIHLTDAGARRAAEIRVEHMSDEQCRSLLREILEIPNRG